jgi:hypothetical protein
MESSKHKILVEELLQLSITLPKGYLMNDQGELCMLEGEKSIPLANFIFFPTEIVQRISEDGVKENFKYIFTGLLKKQTVLNRIEILESELTSYTWIKKWNPFCEVYGSAKKTYDVILSCLFDLLKDTPKSIEFNTIGWHKYNDKWFFLHSGGYIGDTTNDIRTSETRFNINKDPLMAEKEAFLETLKILDICNHKITYSLMSYLLTSIITTPLLSTAGLAPDYVLWIMGDTGSGKTTFSSFFTNIYDHKNLVRPDDNKRTVLDNELRFHKDCILIIDDYGTSKTKEKEYSNINKVEKIIRDLTDRAVSNTEVSQGMLLITGETFLDFNDKNKSTIRRCIRVKMDNIFNREELETFDPQRLERFIYFKDKKILPTLISFYLEWLSMKINANLVDDYKTNFDLLRNTIGEIHNLHGRYSSGFVHQIIAFNYFISYGYEQGFLTFDEQINWCSKAKDIFLDLIEDQYKVIYDKNVQSFLDVLIILIDEKKIKIKYDKALLNFDKNIFGAVALEKEQVVLHLHWDTVYNLVSSRLRKKNFELIGIINLSRLLDSCGLINITKTGTATQLKAIKGNEEVSPRFITFWMQKIPRVKEAIDKQNGYNTRGNSRGLAMLGGSPPL